MITTASKLAPNEETFNRWAKGAKLDPVLQKIIPPGDEFNVLSDLVQSTKNVPKWMFDERSAQLFVLRNESAADISSLCRDVREILGTTRSQHDLDCETHCPSDSQDGALYKSCSLNDLPNAYSRTTNTPVDTASGNSARVESNNSSPSSHADHDTALAFALSSILLVVKHSRLLHSCGSLAPNEAERRLTIGGLMLHPYADPKSPMFYCLERELKLLDIDVEGVEVRSTKPDALVLLEFPALLQGYIRTPGDSRMLYSCLSQPSPEKLRVVHWLAEYKRGVFGRNLALMGIVSALNQRLALGIRDQFVFAMIQHMDDRVQVIAAKWKDQMIRVYLLGEYLLGFPFEVTQLYLLHRAIRNLGTRYYDEIAKKGQRYQGFPTTPSDDFVSWASGPPLRTDLPLSSGHSTTSPIHDTHGDKLRSFSLPSSPGFRDSLRGLKEWDDKSKMEFYFDTMDKAAVQDEEPRLS